MTGPPVRYLLLQCDMNKPIEEFDVHGTVHRDIFLW